MRRLLLTLAACLAPLAVDAASEEDTRLLRMPDIAGDTIAFVYAGDIWTVDARGGTARQLTTHAGLELFPKFSPDGKWIAFSGEYGGNRQVFVIGVEGGTPGSSLITTTSACSRRGAGTTTGPGLEPRREVRPVPGEPGALGRADGALPRGLLDGGPRDAASDSRGRQRLPSPDGKKLAYTPIDREFRTWKRYRGGRAQDVWIYDLERNTAEKITDFDGTDNQPVWIGDTIYFTSDRDERRKLNLWAFDTKKRTTREVTRHEEYDVLWPAGDERRIVYENGGFVYLFDPATERSERVPIRVSGDLPYTVPVLAKVKKTIESVDLSPSAARAVFTARGDLYTVPAKEGESRALTRSQGVRERDAVWSPDGKSIAYLSDRTGEYEIYVRPADGGGEERQLTKGGKIWKFRAVWSPDSTKLAFGDRDRSLRTVEVSSGRVTDVDRGEQGDDIDSYVWSPDSRFPRVRQGCREPFRSSDPRARRPPLVPADERLVSNFAPVFDPGGKYLLPVEPGHQPHVQRVRVQLRAHGPDAHLRRLALRGHAASVLAEERRGEGRGQGQGGREGQGRARRRRQG